MHNVWHLLRNSNREGGHIGSRNGERDDLGDVQDTTDKIVAIITGAVRRAATVAAA